MQDEVVERPGSHEPTDFHKTPKKAAASGWIGSALEYYDFAIYGQAAALVFPAIFFPSGNPTVALVASLATYGGRVVSNVRRGLCSATDRCSGSRALGGPVRPQECAGRRHV